MSPHVVLTHLDDGSMRVTRFASKKAAMDAGGQLRAAGANVAVHEAAFYERFIKAVES